MIIYVPRLIESAEQAEALPVGTVATQAANERWPALACIRVDYGWHCTGETGDDGNMALIGHDLMVGDQALVPIEAEEGTDTIETGEEHFYTRTRYITPWEPQQ